MATGVGLSQMSLTELIGRPKTPCNTRIAYISLFRLWAML